MPYFTKTRHPAPRPQLPSACSLLGYNNLYLIDTIASFKETLHISTRGIKHKLTNENSILLWNKQFGHISKRRIERLVSDKILDPLDFTNFEVYIN